jgi:hypothetical protein
MRFVRKLLGTTAIIVGVAGCATIVGIDDHGYDAGPVVTAACLAYCDTVMGACKSPHGVYSSRSACLNVCAKLPPGDELEPSGATVACRKKEGDNAATTSEPESHCPGAGPGGANDCGSNCEAYCSLLEQTCPKEFGAVPNCRQACTTLRDTGDFDVDHDHDGDTIQCRLVHVSNATVDPGMHCPHAAIASTQYCVAPPEEAPDCAEFCRFNGAGCTGDFAAYESNKQCMAVCQALPAGFNKDREENTMGCRRWHTFNSLVDPASHCAHTGPGGDGHCGVDAPDKTGNCVAYCIIAEKACGTEFATKWGSQTACQLDCSSQPDAFGAKHDSKYRIATSLTGNTLQCRLLHASRALTDMTECPSALGDGACQ